MLAVERLALLLREPGKQVLESYLDNDVLGSVRAGFFECQTAFHRRRHPRVELCSASHIMLEL
jgi:hypothetical protein